MASSNTIRTIDFIAKGKPMSISVPGGVARELATEDGYRIVLADCVVFVPVQVLDAAKRVRAAEQEGVRQALRYKCSACSALPGKSCNTAKPPVPYWLQANGIDRVPVHAERLNCVLAGGKRRGR